MSVVTHSEVKGVVRLADGSPAAGLTVAAVDRDLRSEEALGRTKTADDGSYRIEYDTGAVAAVERGGPDLVVRALTARGRPLAESPVLFDAPSAAVVDLTIPAEAMPPPARLDAVARALEPLLGGVAITALEEDGEHGDVSFLAGETGLDITLVGRFVLAHRLAQPELPAEFWFALLGGGFYRWADGATVAAQQAEVAHSLASLDERAVRAALARALAANEIAASVAKRVPTWVEAFGTLVARQAVAAPNEPTFLQAALDHARVRTAAKRERVARLVLEQRGLTPDAVAALARDGTLTKAQLAAVQASFRLAELTGSDFDLVRAVKERFGVKRPEDVAALARQPESAWVEVVAAAGAGAAPVPEDALPGPARFPASEAFGKALAGRVRAAYPTMAFDGALERALQGGEVPGLPQAQALSDFLGRHPDFELTRTPVDAFLDGRTSRADRRLARDDGFRQTLKAVQRVHKLTGTFDATTALLADGVHAARQVYRMGETAFVRRYAERAHLTAEDARRTWRRAYDTHAAALTIVGDLKALDAEALPTVLQHGADLSEFPNWENLFAGGDLCECEHCNSVLGPGAYLADLLMFLADRATLTPGRSVKDLLLERRPDLGYLELDCDNALTPLPYVDVVNEVLEAAVADNAVELPGFTTMPADPAAAHAAVAAALAAVEPGIGADFTLGRLPGDRWVAHGEQATWLLEKRATPNFFAALLRNTKADADELRAYPQYVNAKACDALRQARHPFALPFDLFGEEVRAAFAHSRLQRWELMQTLVSAGGPSEGQIAAEYFGIGVDAGAPTDERRLILVAAPSVAAQQAIWGETGNAAWLTELSNVKTFLQKTGLEYEELLALLELPLIGGLTVVHQDASCDTASKTIQGLDPKALDRIHRFLRLWRKLAGWELWEVDLAIRCPGVGAGALNEACLIQLFHLGRLRARLRGATVAQLCALLDDLDAGLYARVFADKRVIQPLDPALAFAAVDVPAPTTEKISGHRPAILAALGIGQADLDLLAAQAPLTDDLTLGDLTLLWRHAWLARQLKLGVREWVTALAVLRQTPVFTKARAAAEFVERLDALRAAGFTIDELAWVLAADRTARAATKEPAATRFLTALRAGLKAIQGELYPARYPFLDPPGDTDSLTALLASLLQQLHRDEAGTRFFLDTLRDEVSVAAPVTGMPAGFTFPPAITAAIRIAYDEPAGLLRFTGVMTSSQRTKLLNDPSLSAVTGIPSYKSAIAELRARPRLALKFLDPIFEVPLAALPESVDLTALGQRVVYDGETRVLRSIGILSAQDKAALDGLSSDPAYRAAVAALFAQPSSGTFDPAVLWLTDADLQFPLAAHLDRNLATAATKGLRYLARSRSENLAVRLAGAELGLSEALTRHLLADYAVLPGALMAELTGPFAASSAAVDPATFPTLFAGWYWAARVALLWTRWRLTPPEWERMRDLTAGARLLDVATLPLTAGAAPVSMTKFLRTVRLLALRDALPESDLTLLELLTNLADGRYATSAAFAADVQRVNDAWSDMEALIGRLDATYPGDYLLAETWDRVRRAFAFAASLNAGVATLVTLAGATMGATQAATVKGLLRSRLDPDTWRGLSEEIQDELRERKRDALTAYLLSRPMPTGAPTGKWEDRNELYAYYLLDVEMGACQLTSRLVQGSGSVQLLVQRCLMGLEPEVVASAEDDSAWLWWRWMSKYRVWEANRKVFLWPENWIEPELRPDRSEIFRELEHDLLQDDVTADTGTAAVAAYLEKLDGVAQLEIAGFYQQEDGAESTLHVFGRTPGGDPRVHYHRRFDYRQWTPWEKVDVDIQGHYLAPAILSGRLFLFWPVFTDVSDEAANSTVFTPNANQNSVPVPKTAKRVRVQLALSEYRQGAWTPKKVSKDHYQSGWITVVDTVPKFYEFVPIDRGPVDARFIVKFRGYSLGSDGFEQAELFAAFNFAGCEGVPELVGDIGNYVQVMAPEWASVGQFENPAKAYTEYMKWNEQGRPDEFWHFTRRHDPPQDDFTLENGFAADQTPRYTTVLERTPWLFRMTPSWQLSSLDQVVLDGTLSPSWIAKAKAPSAVGPGPAVPLGGWLPFFYNDNKRTFLVLPVSGKRSYFPDVLGTIRGAEAEDAKLVRGWLDSLDLTSYTSAQRRALDAEMYRTFPDEAPPPLPGDAPPPYTPAEIAQIKPFIFRYLMRYSHANLGRQVLLGFQGQRFHFRSFYHPFACEFARLVQEPGQGVPALMRRETQFQDSGFSFKQQYQPTASVLDPASEQFYPREAVDFSPDAAYAPYNWELFFHVPLLIANALSRNQRFEEARDWYHFIFNPIGVESGVPGGSAMSKYWITKPFFETTDPQYVQQRIENILRLLAGDATAPGSAQAIRAQVLDWRRHPFEPHRIAAYRTVAYQKTVVMRYLDNLIAWADNLFRQDSMESINEATQLYVLAAEVLGPRPKRVPPAVKPPLQTFNELEPLLDDFSNALVEVENLVPPQDGDGADGQEQAPLPLLYFCVPPNDKLLNYWDAIADRLYKIRHCLDIEGAARQVALFEPPIEPGALVKATAAGLDLGSVLADLDAPLPLHRFQVLVQKANEVCGDVKALGGELLSALTSRDAEALGLLRQSQEIRLLEAVRLVKVQQLDEARAALEAATTGRDVARAKATYYGTREFMSVGEALALGLSIEAAVLSTAVQLSSTMAAATRVAVPQVTLGGAGFGGSPVATVTHGGETLADADLDAGNVVVAIATALDKAAAITATLAGYGRRQDDWTFQGDLALLEEQQAEQAIAAAQIRVAVAEQEVANHDLQVANAREVDAFLRSKFTGLELFEWEVGEISQAFFQSYQLAYDLARRAERCFRFELGIEDSNYIRFGYWDSLKQGLLSGEKLQQDLRRLEAAYMERNRREFELTKHVSLLQLDPLALIRLRETGRCFFDLPEEIFDFDYPGHYFRRLKSVSLTLPSVTGPYTTVSCTLRLLRNSVRVSTGADGGYPRNTDAAGHPVDDPRFVESNVPVNAIAASGAQNDAGMFELNFRDERYLPFEGAGAISGWSLELFNDPSQPDFGEPLRQFDYGTITDAVLHVRYTAREDAGPLKTAAIGHLREHFAQVEPAPALVMLDLRRHFPSQWSRMQHPASPADGNVFELEVQPALFPTRDTGKTLKIAALALLARCTDPADYAVTMTPPLPEPPPPGANRIVLTRTTTYGGLHLGHRDLTDADIEIPPTGAPPPWQIRITGPGGGDLRDDPPELQDVLLVLSYAWA